MIIDSHMYCFEPLDQPGGHASGQEHLRWVQRSHGTRGARGFRSTRPTSPAGRKRRVTERASLSNR